MSNIRQVAKYAGVSVATVSRSLANPEKVSKKTLEKVKQAIKELDYRPNLLARNFRASKSYSFIVLVPDITNPFFAEVINAIEDQAQKSGYAVLLGDTRESASREQEYVNRAETRLADGVIQLRPESLSVTSGGIPWVNACGSEATSGASVRIDNVEAMATIVRYVASLGHRKIGLITGKKDNAHVIDRLKGFNQAMDELSLPVNPEWNQEGDFTLESGHTCARAFCTMKEKPTAVCCMNDLMAIGAMQAFKVNGLQVPADVSITGFDDINYACYWEPALTTMAQPAEQLGQRAATMLVDLIEGRPLAEKETVLETQLIVRDSVRLL